MPSPPNPCHRERHQYQSRLIASARVTDAEASALFPAWAWLVFFGLVLGLLFLDLFVL
jgi:hypothetical protein